MTPPELHLLRPLWLLALLPVGWLWWQLSRRRPGAGGWDALVDAPLRPHVLLPTPSLRRRPWWLLLGAGWLALVLALAGPAWQREARPVFRLEQAHVLVVDLADSMDLADLPPSRLGRARFELLDLLGALREGSTALIAYGAEPFLVSPLTRDAATIAAQVPALATDLLPVGGPERADLALDMAGALLARAGAPAGEVLLITDGVGDGEPTRRAAARLRAAGHRLSVLAVVPGGGDGAGAAAATGLRQLAAVGGGELVIARADDADLRLLLPRHDPRGAERSTDPVARAERWRDDGPWLLLLLLPIAALAFRRGWLGVPLIALVLSPPAPALALDWDDLWLRPDQQALRTLQAGDAAAAGERFRDARWRAAALYLAGDYQQALVQLTGQAGVDPHYNRGNVLARLGRYEDAIAEYDAALLLAPDHDDARHNRALLRALLAAPLREQPRTTAPADGGRGGADDDGAGPGPSGPGGAESDAGTLAPGAAEVRAVATEVSGAGAPAEPDAAGDQAAETEPTGGGADAATTASGALLDPGSAAARAADAPSGRVRPDPAMDAPEARLTGALHVGGADGADPAGTPPTQRATAADALLRQVPDDPGGLLRERFMLQYLRRHGQLY